MADSESVLNGRLCKDRQKFSFPAVPTEIDGRVSKNKIIKRVQTRRHVKESGRVNGEYAKIWDQWANWSMCSVTCGIGKLTRWRHCISGSCAPGEKRAQLKTCTLPAC
ncbi:hypothetical protein KM043_000185 [Ampulex compressa]|nr:hypothetical protein KM043_000185 [Ampulex compressa]